MNQHQGHRFTQIYRKFHPQLDSYLKYLSVSTQERDEIIQETFIRYLKWMDKVPDEKTKGFLFKTCRNLRIDYYRAAKKMDHMCPYLTDTHKHSNCHSSDARLTAKKHLSHKIETLQRAPESRYFILHYNDGLKMKEIAEQTQTPIGTVAASIHRFRKKFVCELSSNYESLASVYA